jgi:hypothetical protein
MFVTIVDANGLSLDLRRVFSSLLLLILFRFHPISWFGFVLSRIGTLNEKEEKKRG